ncbi:MAG: copper chaperone PCu(A)C [Parasphingorhabdus sp.]|nr:copper chaperone PCu(A)C [Parasphingorhabdus sp.]
MTRIFGIFTASVALMLIGGCFPAKPLNVVDAWVSLSPVESNPSAIYFTVRGGSQATTLVSITSPDVGRLEIHESKMEGGTMTMAPITEIAIPAGKMVKLEPGGKHIMAWGIPDYVRNGQSQKLPLLVGFSSGERIEVNADLRKMGADEGN